MDCLNGIVCTLLLSRNGGHRLHAPYLRSTSASRGTRTGCSASFDARAMAGMAQLPVGLSSDRVGSRKPFLVVSLALLAVATC